MKILHLTIKKKFFDMIASGEKLEEYRAVKMYWWKRLVECGECYINLSDSLNDVLAPADEWKMIKHKNYDVIEFKNGYSKTSPTMLVEFKGLDRGEARPEWSDNWKGDVFRIKLGKILEANPSGLLYKGKKYYKPVNDVQCSLANIQSQ